MTFKICVIVDHEKDADDLILIGKEYDEKERPWVYQNQDPKIGTCVDFIRKLKINLVWDMKKVLGNENFMKMISLNIFFNDL